MPEFLRKNRMGQVDVFHIISAVRDDNAVIAFLLQVIVKISINALDRRSIYRFAVKRFSGNFYPDASDDTDIVFIKPMACRLTRRPPRMALRRRSAPLISGIMRSRNLSVG